MPRLLHASGRFDAKGEAFAHDLTRWQLLASIITLTEVARPSRWRRLKSRARKLVATRTGWTLTSGQGEGPGECAILSDRAVWKRLKKKVLALTKGGGLARLKRPIYVTAALFLHRALQWRLLVLVAHMPAHVEAVLRAWALHGGRLTAQARSWLAALDSLAEHTADIRRQQPAAHVWVACDWNVDAGAAWARELILEAFARHGCRDLRIVAASRPTLGGRTIDYFLTDLDDAEVVQVLAARASDHHAVLAEVAA